MSAWGGSKIARLWSLVATEYGTICHLCGRPGATTIDHVVPRSHGGCDDLDNLRPAHGTCNSARGALSLTEWFARHPLTRSRAEPSRRWTEPSA